MAMAEGTLAGRMARWALDLSYDDLPPDVVDAAVRHAADSLACAVAAYPTEAVRILRHYALARGGRQEATILGTNHWVDANLAALVGGTMVRYVDANDIYFPPPGPHRWGAHFSDALPGVLAVAERSASDGREFLTALVIAYELQAALCEAMEWMTQGFHSLTQIAFALPIAAGRLMGMSLRQIEWAVGLSGSTGLVLNSWLQPSTNIPMIKGGAPGLASERAIVAADLASAGFSAPDDALETLLEKQQGASLEYMQDRVAQLGRVWTMTRNTMKMTPSQIMTQAPVQAALQVRAAGCDPARLSAVTIWGSRGACAGVQGSPQAFAPESREAADHSTPYVVATALLTGSMTERAYEGNRWLDPEMRAFMGKVRLVVDPERERGWNERGEMGCRLVAETEDGQTFEAELRQPRGHWEDPMTSDDLLAKMENLVDYRYGVGAAQRILDACRALPDADDLTGVIEACRVE